jgi:hypothetical protein
MIYGVIPVGGKGTRLGLPYSKEMLPQKNYDYYNPVMNHLVEKMEMAGANNIIFVHGLEYKADVVDFFTSSHYVHIKQTELGFAKVLSAARDFIGDSLIDNDKILFGLPDSVFDGNPFVEMLLKKGIVCGLFTTNTSSKVDRLNRDSSAFQVKTSKTDNNTDWFWGLIKFDSKDFDTVAGQARTRNEIGDILNLHGAYRSEQLVEGSRYLDLGTWTNYNRYLSDPHSFSNTEIERKYDATNIDVEQFIDVLTNIPSTLSRDNFFYHIVSTDFYYKNDNPNIEFIRYREPSEDKGAIGDITIKNFKKSPLNRFELTLKLDNPNTQNVIQFLNLLGATFEFEVTKECHIFHVDSTSSVVLYTFEVNKKKHKILEIETSSNMNSIIEMEQYLSKKLDGFDPSAIITLSKYQLIKGSL